MSMSVSEVNAVPSAAPVPARGDSQRALPFVAPAEVAAPQATAGAATKAQLDQAVAELNSHFSAARTDLKFSVEKDLGVIVVAVVDAQDGKVLRQIPSEEAIRIARVITQQRNGLIEATA